MNLMIHFLITYQKLLPNAAVREGSPPKLKDYPKLNLKKKLVYIIKKGMVLQVQNKKEMKICDLHLYLLGLLHLEKNDRVVETKLCFCLIKECVTNTKSLFNNMMALNLNTVIKRLIFREAFYRKNSKY